MNAPNAWTPVDIIECIAGSPLLWESRLALQGQQQECVAVPQVQIHAAILLCHGSIFFFSPECLVPWWRFWMEGSDVRHIKFLKTITSEYVLPICAKTGMVILSLNKFLGIATLISIQSNLQFLVAWFSCCISAVSAKLFHFYHLSNLKSVAPPNFFEDTPVFKKKQRILNFG